MYGNIIGDLAGSIYEYEQFKCVKPISCDTLITDDSFISDDSVLTVAVMDAIINNKDYETKLKEYGLKYIDKIYTKMPYFNSSFSPGFIRWLKGNFQGNSIGNCAMMRIAPVGYLFDNIEDIEKNVKAVTIPSHNSKEAIACAEMIAKIIFLARQGNNKEQIMNLLNIKLQYQPFTSFNSTCHETIGNCLYALFTSDSFEESLKKVISYGGDTDTNACIVGGMAEALYGIDNSLIEQANKKIPESFSKVLKKYYK